MRRVLSFLLIVSISVFIQQQNVQAASPGPTIYYHHLDHLNGQGATTNEQGQAVEITDYYPYGAPHHNDQNTSFTEQRKFGGHEYDGSGLNYYGQRYASPLNAKFLSRDPQVDELTLVELADPQRLNAYSLVRNNPLRFVDDEGKAARDFQRAFPTTPVFARGLQRYGAGNRPLLGFASGERMGAYKGVSVLANGYNGGSGQGDLRYQCVGFVKSFYQQTYNVAIGKVGTAQRMTDIDVLNGALPPATTKQFVSYENRKTAVAPQDDDIIGWHGGAYGHVGVVANVHFDSARNQGYVDVVEQNWGGMGNASPISRHQLTRDPQTGAYTIADRQGYALYNWMRLTSKDSSASSSK